ncbi:MAG: Ig-like domain-containing protein [Eubacterium sp.]|nr:Ig-like domain-containing protein [Eubacterium sp.]
MRVKKITAGILAVLLAIQFTAISAFAVEDEVNADISIESEESEKTAEQAEDELFIEEAIERTPITADTVPEIISYERVLDDGFTSRLKTEELSMSEIILEKEDGTRALYLFDTDVKYVDENGETVDKSNKAVQISENSQKYFTSESNDIEVKLPLSLTAGISVSDDEFNIVMRPVTKIGTHQLSIGAKSEENSVYYQNVFDTNTDIEYTFTYDGVKEDIILKKYNGTNTFEFVVYTGGLTLYEDKGTLLLADANGDVQASLGEVIVYSADNKNNTMGEFIVEEQTADSVYTVTVTVDKRYLTDPNTAYPVTIDPSITLTSSSSIQDIQVFKGTDGKGNETSSGTSGVSRVGWSNWGPTRTLMRFPGINFAGHDIKQASQISSAYVELRDLMCEGGSAVPISCAQFTGYTWDEATTKTWNQLLAGNCGSSLDMVQVTYGNGNSTRNVSFKDQWYRWNIKTVVKDWVTSSDHFKKGICFKMHADMLENSSVYSQWMKTFCSMQGDAQYRPYFVMTYDALINFSVAITPNTRDANQLKVGSSRDYNVTVTPPNLSYTTTWSSSNASIATVSSSGLVKGLKKGIVTITATVTSSQGETRIAKKEIYVGTNIAKVEVLYDYGYKERFTTSSQSAATRINNIMEKVRVKYFNDFGIILDVSSPVLYKSYADQCPQYGNNIDKFCECGGKDNCSTPDKGGNLHHKNVNQIMIHNKYEDDIDKIVHSKPNETTQNDQFITLIFTGHVACYIENDTHYLRHGMKGLAFHTESISAIFSGNIANDNTAEILNNIFDFEIAIAVHEIGHQFGAPDHYAPATGDENCMYGKSFAKASVFLPIKLCSSCSNEIKSNAKRYNGAYTSF